ncbi:hypothetical protein NKG94_10475 [Micromonospora sp. M12]
MLFHSVYGLRPAVRAAADRLRAAGHQVVTPDLYGVPASDSVEEGFAVLDKIGQEAVLDRARAALRDLPPETVLAGVSMGAGVAGRCWPSALTPPLCCCCTAPVAHRTRSDPGCRCSCTSPTPTRTTPRTRSTSGSGR